MSKNLLLTLGHNSSAVLMDDDKVVCGYENERLSKVKSDSAFPSLAIMECLNNKKVFVDKLDYIYISYWNDAFDIFEDASYVDKHIDKKFLSTLCKHYGCKIKYLSEDFTHHDAHAYAALNFFENHATEDEKKQDFHIIVSDGFGNKEETTTVYHVENGELKKIDKRRDYFTSVGLMYQYATSFCGMKENEDEYKFLGYESHIKEVLTENQIISLYDYADKFVETFYNATKSITLNYIDSKTKYINVEKLGNVKKYWFDEFDKLLRHIGFEKINCNISHLRTCIGAFIQRVIEQFIGKVIEEHKISNVILSGGIFYNVKLNNFIMNIIPGKICVYPVCGDQGVAFGLYRKYFGPFEFKTLLIGDRDLEITSNKSAFFKGMNLDRFERYDDPNEFINRIVALLKEDKIVNIMTGNLEFGPRALGSTTTMALPTKKNVSYINILNDRDDAMPMAPQILASKTKKYFGNQVNKIIGSNFYMIITMDQIDTPNESYIGISHKYPLKDVYSSRCQIIPDESNQYTRYVLEKLSDVNDFMINTSLNYHGTPILYTVNDVVKNHILTMKNDVENRSYTIVGCF
jgi:predicted NodU family carbamoyl transferase